MLSDLTSVKQVENILVFISDSLRFDELPNSVKSNSMWGRAIAASTFTGSGFPSIMTGKYPVNHRVWELTDTLPATPNLLNATSNSGIDATNVWATVPDPENKPPLRMCHEQDNTTIDDIESPFTLVIHDQGGHMQYGKGEQAQWNSHKEFFTDLADDPSRIRDLYREGVDESMNRFSNICAQLKSRKEFENTLVILTSDHGELLGEYGGLYDHGAPVVPELVSVPMVFMGANLPTNEEIDVLLSTTDIVPTVFAALNKTVPSHVNGYDIWNRDSERINNRIVRSEIWRQPDYPMMSYQASSAWTSKGGIVRHLNSISSRLSYLLAYEYYYAPYSNMVRKLSSGTMKQLKAYLKPEITYGEFSRDSIQFPQDFESEQQSDATTEGPNKRQLRDLGYLE
ncbi:Sulfatase [Haloplanus vescus]|uniref:Sulfatase n=1 Tax=Haloplanus vescus TaxID=555874 RepID=A0A1H3XIH3_9EURY|nr:sulfatase-like hydrolase/transferase [Haloplanus vescus]SDZ98348.1 Sulfatase [Haloplanus vescus]